MCLSLQKFYQTLVLMTSPDNPNSLCRPDTKWYCTCKATICTILTLISIVASYFLTLGFGLAASYVIHGRTYNMTTGCRLNGDCNRLMCYADKGAGFYLGCFISGLICDIIILIVCGLIWFYIACVIPYCHTLKSETANSFDSAKNIVNENVTVNTADKDGDTVIELED